METGRRDRAAKWTGPTPSGGLIIKRNISVAEVPLEEQGVLDPHWVSQPRDPILGKSPHNIIAVKNSRDSVHPG